MNEDEDADAQAHVEFAHWQLERELTARQQLARGAGLALIDLTSVLEEHHAILDRSVDPLGIVLVAFAARGRRALRSAYRLMDAGEVAEAVPLLRTISEYLVVARWLLEHPESLEAWALADYDKRDYVIGEVIREFGDADPETTAALDQQREHLKAGREQWRTSRGEPEGHVLRVEQMAAQIGLGFAYQLGYRTQSQIDVHATPAAADSCYERMPDGTLRLLPAPQHALRGYDQYELGAHMLRDLLATTNQHVRSFLWTTGLEGITAALNGPKESDPRRYLDPADQVIAAGGSASAPREEIDRERGA